MLGFAAFSDAGFSSQTTADARIIPGTQVLTSTIAGVTILGGAIVVVTTAGSLTSSVGTATGKLIAFPSTNLLGASIAGAIPEVRVFPTSAGLLTTTVQSMGAEYSLLLKALPSGNLLSGETGTPSIFTWLNVDDNVTDETSTWSDVDTEDTTETTKWRQT